MRFVMMILLMSCAGRGASVPPCRPMLTGGAGNGGAGPQCEVRR